MIDASSFNSSDAGSIIFNVNNLEVIRGGKVFTSSVGIGKAGDLFITAIESVNVNSQGIITTSSQGADSGNLTIKTSQFNLSDPGSVD